MRYAEHSETPHAYDFWTGCYLLSVALGRSVIVDRPFAPVYLNIYIILVADSGITRKSTAVRRCVKFMRDLCSDEHPLIESKITPEKLEYDLALQTAEYGSAYTSIAIDELVKFLGKEKYVETMPTLLTDLYDAPELRTGGGSLTRGKTCLRRVFVNFLSASTASWLIRAVNPDVIEGGFTSRVIFVVSEEPKRSSPWPEAANEDLERSIKDDLLRIRRDASSVSRIQLTEAAKRRFATWYRSRDKKRDPFRASFQSREDAHVLRLAALLSVNDGLWEIQANHITSAIRIITETREDGAAIFEGTGANSALVLGIDALRDKLLAAGIGGAKQTELTKALQRHMNAEHVKVALNLMHDLGMVQRFENIQVGKGRPSTLWRATTSLVDSKALDKIIGGMNP
jgi:ribosomal protein L31E